MRIEIIKGQPLVNGKKANKCNNVKFGAVCENEGYALINLGKGTSCLCEDCFNELHNYLTATMRSEQNAVDKGLY